jgi:hypothetical protein
MTAFRNAVLLLLAATAHVYPVAARYGLGGHSSGPKKFELSLTWEEGAPDGVKREMVFVNGEYPGPPLVVEQGDDVEVSVDRAVS